MTIKLSVVILSMTKSAELHRMTMRCIESLIMSEKDISKEIILIESNKKYYSSGLIYPDIVKVIIPEADFNFHKFLNIGIKASVGEFIALCNNDLIFHKNWFKEILRVKDGNRSIMSFSPNELQNDLSNSKSFEIGFKVQSHVKGWCLVAHHSVFPRIGYLDELFDFYYADNDYSMSLKCHNIKHAVVYNSYVEHLEKQTSADILLAENNHDFLDKYRIPHYLYATNYRHVLSNEKGLEGFLKFYSKWGDPKWVFRKNKIAEVLFKFNLGYFANLLYRRKKKVNILKTSK